MISRRLYYIACVLAVTSLRLEAAAPEEVSRVLPADGKLSDPRLGPLRNTRDTEHPWAPPATKEEWEKSAEQIRHRLLIATGLWPMPPKEPLKPVIHGKIDRGDYTIEKVYFASLPGHYVSGNLYRPAKVSGKIPGVLVPHGHWANGRFFEAKDDEAKAELASKAEAHQSGAKYPLQACAQQLARMGCIVFHYDMVGNADSQSIPHASGFADAEAELRLQSAMGLQTFNSIRALDFLLSQPNVDASRVGVTGSSGGGTQTFMLCAVDPRVTAAFPAVMVSANMQGGCVCENADLLRIGINNVAIMSLFAPKPVAMSGANDWTIDIESKGLPEMKQVWGYYGQSDLVDAKCFPQFGHNYNQVAREMMYGWFNAHLKLDQKSPIVEQDFTPVPPKELSVYNAEHPRPADSRNADGIRKYWTEVARKQWDELLPKSAADVDRYRDVVGWAARTLLDEGLPQQEALNAEAPRPEKADGLTLLKGMVDRADDRTQLPYAILRGAETNGTAVIWLDVKGKSHLFDAEGKPNAAVKSLVKAGYIVASIDMFASGEFQDAGKPAAKNEVDSKYAGYTYAYNRPLIAQRVHDVMTAMVGIRILRDVTKIKLVGTGDAGPVAILAASLLRGDVEEVIADAHGLSYASIPAASDANFLPGALKYGGLFGLAALAAPTPLTVAGTESIPAGDLAPVQALYKLTDGKLEIAPKPLTPELVVERVKD